MHVSHTKRKHQNYLAKITIVNFTIKIIPRLSLLLCTDSNNLTENIIIVGGLYYIIKLDVKEISNTSQSFVPF